jgi:hypothetical protein
VEKSPPLNHHRDSSLAVDLEQYGGKSQTRGIKSDNNLPTTGTFINHQLVNDKYVQLILPKVHEDLY